MKNYYTIYKTTNIINNKIYIGKHKTNNLKDGYVGSGKHLWYAIKKYGIEYFEVEILYILETQKEMDDMEREIVNEEFVERKDTYNLKIGGLGGWENISPEDKSKGAIKMNEIIWADPEFRKRRSKFASELCKKLHSEGRVPYDNFKEKCHSEETKEKMRQSAKGKHDGEKNSQYGTCWIHNIEIRESKKIKKEAFESWSDEGWKLGRKIKW